MERPVAVELPTRRIALALAAIEEATDLLLDDARRLDDTAVHEASALPGWSRANVLAHLLYGAEASRRVTDEALAGRPTAYYPGGMEQREASIRAGDNMGARTLADRLEHASTELSRRWHTVPPGQWKVRVHEDRVGTVALSRWVILRLTELEVHHADLRVGFNAEDWSDAFVRLALPLRLAWLPRQHRARADHDASIDGTWLFRCTDTGTNWRVSARDKRSTVRAVDGDAAAGVTLEGPARAILAVVLGRRPVSSLVTSGEVALARSFKTEFPGP